VDSIQYKNILRCNSDMIGRLNLHDNPLNIFSSEPEGSYKLNVLSDQSINFGNYAKKLVFYLIHSRD